jgi:peptidoglycan-N-acetylglucosamine deacetylase
LVAVLVPLALPIRGGGDAPYTPPSITRVSRPPPEPMLPAPANPTKPATTRDRFPRFLNLLGGKPGATEAAGPSVNASGRRVRELMLSFDDGPDLSGTPLVLDQLDRRGLKGIFFVNGRYLTGSRSQDLARRELIRKLATHGHLVANHTLTHKNICQFPESIPDEVDANSEIIAYATGLRPLLFRSPYGVRCRVLEEALRQREMIQIGWNLDPQEWKAENPDAVFAYVTENLARLQGRAILLLHDTHPSAVRALPRILSWIDEENARMARQGGIPIRIVDYSVFLPERPVPPTGLEPLLSRIAETFSVLPAARM